MPTPHETDRLLEQLRVLPKIDLHRHLEGSPRLETLADIVRTHALDLPDEAEALRPLVQIMPNAARTAAAFLSKFSVLRRFFISEAVIRRLVAESILDATREHICYLELRFTPAALNNIVQVGFVAIVAWVCDAVRQAEIQAAAEGTPIQVRLLLSINRHESAEIGMASLEAALVHPELGTRLVGIDFGGREDGHPLTPHRATIERARAAGLGLTLHAGEWLGAESVRETVLAYAPTRIGHGVRAAESGEVMALLAERGIVLEVCPSSNIDSGIYPSFRAHTLPLLMANGVRTTLNSDDPLVCGITLTDELARIATGCGVSLAGIRAAMLTAAEAAFLPAPERAALMQTLAKPAGDPPQP